MDEGNEGDKMKERDKMDEMDEMDETEETEETDERDIRDEGDEREEGQNRRWFFGTFGTFETLWDQSSSVVVVAVHAGWEADADGRGERRVGMARMVLPQEVTVEGKQQRCLFFCGLVVEISEGGGQEQLAGSERVWEESSLGHRGVNGLQKAAEEISTAI
ncbi:uncharacterized protein PADG_05531 [Paracoccidioides brasiliensis Pb18]|uniref:Uncharacterized protein n=1 Tax=Paracoccidioides brasiliensis (strain Pb18) TaxID=502780 RepID=C1GE45_PARBD|nr:uncharacterized protein PADG_05531 [Paracoccidioides brasiliensis Pb18]EEH49452.2 hypothetical protein PADG_05531 [Paracoccidioides brasiliensis Pb18]